MQSRHIVITLGAAAAAFAVAFGLGKVTSGSEASTGTTAGEAAQSFEVPSAAISAATPKATLPALKPKPKPKPTPEPSAPSSPAPAPTAAPSTPAPAAPAPAPAPAPNPEPGPVTGGGEG